MLYIVLNFVILYINRFFQINKTIIELKFLNRLVQSVTALKTVELLKVTCYDNSYSLDVLEAID